MILPARRVLDPPRLRGGGAQRRKGWILPACGEVARSAGGVLTGWLAMPLLLRHRRCMTLAVTKRARRLRSSMTGAELRVWVRLRGRKLDGWKFRRQHPIGPYVVDFYCPGACLVVEINGPTRDGDAAWAYDQRRQAWLEAEGYRVLRIPVSSIDSNADDVAVWILAVLDEQEAIGHRRRPLRPALPATCAQARQGRRAERASPPSAQQAGTTDA